MTSRVAAAVPGAAVREAGSGQTGKAGQDGHAVGAVQTLWACGVLWILPWARSLRDSDEQLSS